MSKVGIIANPDAGRDIRRLVAHATVTGMFEKVGIVRRAVMALLSTGVDEIIIMPDFYNLGNNAISGMRQGGQDCRVTILEMPLNGDASDSMQAARQMNEAAVDCIITVGGDGTNRTVARACGRVPLLPISTGTNNVFPSMVEGTTAGLAAGIIARGIVDPARCIMTAKKLDVLKNGQSADLALVDAAVLDEAFIGSRAIWDISRVREVILTQSHPAYIGMASIGGSFHPVAAADDCGLYIRLGEGSMRVRAAIAPGMVEDIGIEEYCVLKLGERVQIRQEPSLLAFDGEREMLVYPGDCIEIELCRRGPRVVKIRETLEEAVRQGFFISRQG